MSQTVYNYSINDIKGNPIDLAQYKSKKLLLVNTASACGLTPQYKQLEELHQHFNHKVQIIGLPCNDFGEQEPGTPQEIEKFCEVNYGVTFPLTEKIKVLGADAHPLYKYLTSKELNGHSDSEVKWNFQKYLVDETGHLVQVFSPMAEPLSEEILKEIER
ncbi:MAG TPA: glutathione peroxidase [Chitinophagales bacterium]|nr:glutathione peroxidase [Chitinophagales bacterium]